MMSLPIVKKSRTTMIKLYLNVNVLLDIPSSLRDIE